MPTEGAGPNDARAERVTSNAGEDWFPHPSLDSNKFAYVEYEVMVQ